MAINSCATSARISDSFMVTRLRRACNKLRDPPLRERLRHVPTERMFLSMDRRYEVESLRRSIAMLSPNAPPGLSREEAFTLVTELQEAEERLRRLRDGLERLLAGDSA
jgi:hypothetical protein